MTAALIAGGAAFVALAMLLPSGCSSSTPSTSAQPEESATVVTEAGVETVIRRNDQVRIEVPTATAAEMWSPTAHSEAVLHLVDTSFEDRDGGVTVMRFVGVSPGETVVVVRRSVPAPDAAADGSGETIEELSFPFTVR